MIQADTCGLAMFDQRIKDSYVVINHFNNVKKRETVASFSTDYAQPKSFKDQDGNLCFGDEGAQKRLAHLIASRKKDKGMEM